MELHILDICSHFVILSKFPAMSGQTITLINTKEKNVPSCNMVTFNSNKAFVCFDSSMNYFSSYEQHLIWLEYTVRP